MEFLKNRNWQSHEFAELVNATTERVNSTTASATKDAIQNITSGSSTYPKRARTDHPNKHAGPSKKAQVQQIAAGAKPKFVGKTPGETSAITQYCYENGLCKLCKGRHHFSKCRTKEIKAFTYPPDWDESFWNNRSNTSSEARKKAKNS